MQVRESGRTRKDNELAPVLAALRNLGKGDTSVRLPAESDGIAGLMATAFNDVAESNQRMTNEMAAMVAGLRALARGDASVRLPRALPRAVVDHSRVGEVFSNLVANAIKYNDKSARWVEIGWRPAGDAGPRVPVYYVKDNGIGIAQQHHDAIFRIFRRLHGREEYGGGVGVGLTIVRKIVERHGGRIWVESAPGEGTTFYFTLAPGK